MSDQEEVYNHHKRTLPFTRHRHSLAGRSVLVLSNVLDQEELGEKKKKKPNKKKHKIEKKKKELIFLVSKVLIESYIFSSNPFYSIEI